MPAYRHALQNPDYIPVEALHPVLTEWIDKYKAKHPYHPDPVYGAREPLSPLAYLEFVSGVPRRTLHRFVAFWEPMPVKRGGKTRFTPRSRWIKVDTLDKLLTGMDLSHLWHLPWQDGGFAGLY